GCVVAACVPSDPSGLCARETLFQSAKMNWPASSDRASAKSRISLRDGSAMKPILPRLSDTPPAFQGATNGMCESTTLQEVLVDERCQRSERRRLHDIR